MFYFLVLIYVRIPKKLGCWILTLICQTWDTFLYCNTLRRLSQSVLLLTDFEITTLTNTNLSLMYFLSLLVFLTLKVLFNHFFQNFFDRTIWVKDKNEYARFWKSKKLETNKCWTARINSNVSSCLLSIIKYYFWLIDAQN